MKGVLSNNLTREYSLFQIDNRYLANIDLDDRILKWLYRILEYTKHVLKCITTVTRIDIPVNSLDLGEIPKGACHGAFEAIKNSNIHSKPRILDAGISVDSSSTFLDAKVNAIVNIDISLKSTTLSLSFLNDDGLVEEKFGHNELTDEKCLPFILFADNHLVDDIKHLNDTEGDRARNTACTLYIEKLLSNNSPCTNGASESTKQKVYIKAFLLVYMIYINEIISRKLLDRLNRGPMNIGYAVSIDKFLLEGVTGAIDVFKNILYASGLVPKDDNSMKLRVIMQGEGMLPAIQKYLNLELPLKSYFVLAQIHEGHIQLTLNQTVTDPDWKGEQESIIVEDEIVPIENIYDSFCLNVWRNIVENSDSIQLCDEHTDGTSLKTKKEFEVIFMQYILENVRNIN
ncbi:hypothetical protein HPULCUR_005611 [Helicostylum pulchrum]|uniref:Uncharacterized protein n=1 Tax=Helicostylum pulchrum TaxID=562976 RepID=A0ABP9XZN6_9FUNG